MGLPEMSIFSLAGTNTKITVSYDLRDTNLCWTASLMVRTLHSAYGTGLFNLGPSQFAQMRAVGWPRLFS